MIEIVCVLCLQSMVDRLDVGSRSRVIGGGEQNFIVTAKYAEESGMLDGLNRFGIFTRIALPLAWPALGALAVLTFLASWNAYLEPLLYVNDLPLFTLPLALANFVDAYGVPMWNIQLAATALSIIPVLIFYIMAQRRVIESFSSSGVKG